MSFQDLEAGRVRRSNNGYTNGFKQMDPTQAIASGIFQINTGVNTFQRLVNTLGTPKDTPELRDKLWCYDITECKASIQVTGKVVSELEVF
ncbi:Syntaxin/epimorphin, conserved site-containing protein [Artemisia annua]|uniref:Syntaxin/epimorphin, conserved site-containing protein n=1 Tax=Artemisia annua TaxID=35608 RepID=A0A2U1K8J5_ARTAN|nr:Syntaxin/epimorphin, conserved site-containing protein [Artemisia annua]